MTEVFTMEQQERLMKDYLLQRIHNGAYTATDKLPSEYELVEQFQLSRIKVRNVYTMLEKMGLIYSQKGVGRFIQHTQKPLQVVMTGQESFSEKMSQQAAKYKSVVTKLEQVPHTHPIYKRHHIHNQTLYLIERLRFIDDEPAALHRSYVVIEHVPQVKQIDHRLTSMYQFYRKCGITSFTSTFSELSIQYATEFDREMLQCEMLVPLAKVESDNWDVARNTLLEYTEILYRTDRFSFQLT